ncbi:TetR family transcriptional regulator [Nonomuraea thailandensis]
MRAVRRARGRPADRLRAALLALVRYTLDRRAVARLYQWEGRHLDAEGRAVLAAPFDGAVRTLREELLRARPGLIRQDAALLIAATLSVIASPATHRASLSRGKAERTLLDCVAVLIDADLPAPPRQASPRKQEPDVFALLPRRERLLAEAIRLFRERGYHQVSISDIGQAAGINASSVYTHFASKAELLAAAYYRATSRLEHTTAAALAGAGTPAQALGRGRRLCRDHLRPGRPGRRLPLREREPAPADLRRLRAAQRRHVDTWTGLVARIRPGRGRPRSASGRTRR